MGRLTKTLLATTLAIGGMFAASSPASASGGDLVDIKVGDIVILNDITVEAAALVCGIVDVTALVADLNDGDNEADCLDILNGKIIKN